MTHLKPTHPVTVTLSFLLALGCSSHVEVAQNTGGAPVIGATGGHPQTDGGTSATNGGAGGTVFHTGGTWPTSPTGGAWAGGSQATGGKAAGTGGAVATGGTVSCDQLQSAAQTAFMSFVAANQGCSIDADCVYQGGFAMCVDAGCIALNAAAVSAAASVATQACAPSDANNCYDPYHGCPAAFAACVQGTCTAQIGGAGGSGSGGANATGGKGVAGNDTGGAAATGGTDQGTGGAANGYPNPGCTYGADQTCNDDPSVSAIWGQCDQNGYCTCNSGYVINPATGKCNTYDQTVCYSPTQNIDKAYVDRAFGCNCNPTTDTVPWCGIDSQGLRVRLYCTAAGEWQSEDTSACN